MSDGYRNADIMDNPEDNDSIDRIGSDEEKNNIDTGDEPVDNGDDDDSDPVD